MRMWWNLTVSCSFWRVGVCLFSSPLYFPAHSRMPDIELINKYRRKFEELEVELHVSSQTYDKYRFLMHTYIYPACMKEKCEKWLLNNDHIHKASAFISKSTLFMDWINNFLMDVFQFQGFFWHGRDSLQSLKSPPLYLLISSKCKCKCNRKLEWDFFFFCNSVLDEAIEYQSKSMTVPHTTTSMWGFTKEMDLRNFPQPWSP